MPGCCGGKRSRGAAPPANNPAPQAASLPGKAGMVRLRYTGRNVGDTTWWGPETNTRYIFGGNRRVGYVDANDAAGMLEMRDKEDRRVFQLVKGG